MSIYLSGTTFPNRFVRPVEDAALFRALVSDGIYDGCSITTLGSTLKLAAGRLVACGRCARVPTDQDIAVTGASSGYARLVLTIDLSASNTGTVFQQVKLDVEYAATLGGFDSLTQQDLQNGGTTYQIVICVVSLAAAGITGIVSTCGRAHARALGVEVTLPSANWNSTTRQQTVRIDGVTADANVQQTYALASKAAWIAADIDIVAQGAGNATFEAAVIPDQDIVVNVLIS